MANSSSYVGSVGHWSSAGYAAKSQPATTTSYSKPSSYYSGGNNATSGGNNSTYSSYTSTTKPATTTSSPKPSSNYNGGNSGISSSSTPAASQTPVVTSTPAATPTPELKSEEKTAGSVIGGSTSGTDINMQVSVESLVQSKVKLDAAATGLDTLWRAILAQIDAISTSWVGPDAKAYTDKLKNMGPKVDAALNALKKLSSTYEKALNEIDENQQKIKSELL